MVIIRECYLGEHSEDGKIRGFVVIFQVMIMNTLKQKLILQENNMNDGVLTGKSMEQILKEKNIMLKRQIDKMDTELSAYKELAITSVLTAGFNFDSKPYKELVRLVGIKTIILAKIRKGIALTTQEKEYLTNNLR
jgi:hypothetical protein